MTVIAARDRRKTSGPRCAAAFRAASAGAWTRRGGRTWAFVLLALAVGAAGIPVHAEEPPAVPAPPGELEFVGHNLFGDAEGTFHDWRIVDARIDPERLEESHATVEVRLASVDTGNERRDEHLRSEDFFEVERFPVATARVHSLRVRGRTEEGRARYAASFDLDLHGVERTLEGEIVHVRERPPAFEGRLVVDRLEFGVGPPDSVWNPLSIDREVPVRFRVTP